MCKETLERFNKLFSDDKMKEFIKNSKKNQENKNINNEEYINNNDNINPQINQSESKKEQNILESSNNEENNIIIKKEDIDYIQNKEEINNNDNNYDIYQNNGIINISKEESNEKENQNIKNNEDIKEIIPKNKTYYFSQENLENYYQIFISLEDYLNSLIKKNAFNDIINYGDTRLAFKIGIENLILIIKSYPFNILRNIYQKQYYKDVLRQIFMPYIRRAFNNINLYVYHLTKFSEVNKALEQIYRIVFIKRLIYYGQGKVILKKEYQDKINEFINKLKSLYKKKFFKELCENIKIKEQLNESNNSSLKKYNTYLYESLSEKSSLTAYPNTEGSARLHKVYELLEMQGKQKEEENNISENVNSNRSDKIDQRNKRINFFDKIKDEKELNIHYDDLKNNLNQKEKKEINDEHNQNKNEIEKIDDLEFSNKFNINNISEKEKIEDQKKLESDEKENEYNPIK